MQVFGRYVTVPAFQKQPGERQALPGRPQPGGAQAPESG